MLMAIAATFLSVHIHFKSVDEDDDAIPEGIAWTAASVLGGSWVAVFLVFILLMKRKYRASFFSLETGNEWAQSRFLIEDEE